MGIAIVYENFADTAILSGGNWQSGNVLANVQSNDIGIVARSTNASPSSSIIVADLGSPRPVGGIVVGPMNVAPGASYRIQSFTDVGLSDQVYDSGMVTLPGQTTNWADLSDWLSWEDPNFWHGIKLNEWPELPNYIVHTIPAGLSIAFSRYWKISISDPSNASGHIDIGRLLIGRIYRPAYNYTYSGNETGFTALVDISETMGGQRVAFHRGMRRKFRCAFENLPEAEVFQSWFRLAFRARLDRQIFVIPDEEDRAGYQQRAFLATMESLPPIQQATFQRASITFDCSEVL